MPTDTTPELPARPAPAFFHRFKDGKCATRERLQQAQEIREQGWQGHWSPMYTGDALDAYALAAIAADRASASRATPVSTEPKPESPAELAADEALRRMYALRDEVWKSARGSEDVDVGEAMLACRSAIEKLAALATIQASAAPLARPVSREAWISVDERLPNEWTKVWVANFDDVQEAVFDHTEGKFQVEDVYGAYENAYGVTHWMLRVPPAAPTSTPSAARKD